MNKQLMKDVKKELSKHNIGELSPGSTGRRYEPTGGLQKHRERIHRESKIADDHKNLEFTFSKPAKPRGRTMYIRCDSCGYNTSATTVTVGIICPECKKFSTVTEVVVDE